LNVELKIKNSKFKIKSGVKCEAYRV